MSPSTLDYLLQEISLVIQREVLTDHLSNWKLCSACSGISRTGLGGCAVLVSDYLWVCPVGVKVATGIENTAVAMVDIPSYVGRVQI